MRTKRLLHPVYLLGVVLAIAAIVCLFYGAGFGLVAVGCNKRSALHRIFKILDGI
jgi:hypothetical protein